MKAHSPKRHGAKRCRVIVQDGSRSMHDSLDGRKKRTRAVGNPPPGVRGFRSDLVNYLVEVRVPSMDGWLPFCSRPKKWFVPLVSL